MPLVRSAASSEQIAIGETQLRANLESSDEEVRRAAVRLATRTGEAALLAQRFQFESDAGLREAILTGLVRIGGLAAARPLIEALRGGDAPLRTAVIETLQNMGEAIVPELEKLLKDADPDMRIYAVNILQSLRCLEVPDMALRVIATDPHVNVCAAAVDVLAEVGRPEMATALAAVADRFPGDPFLGFAVRAAIKRIG